MDYEGPATPVVRIPDVEVPRDVAEWLTRQAASLSWSCGEWLAHLVTVYARMDRAATNAGLREVVEGGLVKAELP